MWSTMPTQTYTEQDAQAALRSLAPHELAHLYDCASRHHGKGPLDLLDDPAWTVAYVRTIKRVFA